MNAVELEAYDLEQKIASNSQLAYDASLSSHSAAEAAQQQYSIIQHSEAQIDTINLRKGKISLRKSVRKSGMNKDAIKDGLMSFFFRRRSQGRGCTQRHKGQLKSDGIYQYLVNWYKR